MSDPTADLEQENDPLELDRADYGEHVGSLSCQLCEEPITDYYYRLGERTACKHCQPKVATEMAKNPRFWRAGAFGLGAALVGAGIWYAVIALTGYELGLIAIVVGFMVGGAVRVGSGGVGGLSVQLLAVFLTYTAVVTSYAPLMYAEFQNIADEELFQTGLRVGDETEWIAIEAGSEAAPTAASTPNGTNEANVFLTSLGSALETWSTEGEDDTGRERALDDMYGSLQSLLAVNATPTFGFGETEVTYAGLALPESNDWAWGEKLHTMGIGSLEFDDNVTRVGLVSFLDEMALTIEIEESMGAPTQTAFGIAFLLALLYLAPVLAGFENIIGILIIGFALWEAWKMNRRQAITIEGPFEVESPAPVAG